jgi:predicted metal-dependent enzyme (double-stranded beta helix superfamily)
LKTQAHINTLINVLSESSKEDYTEILLNFNFKNIDFSEIEYWEPQCYTRNCFYKDDDFELILICWDKGQQTAIHNHDGEDCWVYLLEGEIEEDFYRLNDNEQLEFCATSVLEKGQVTKSDKLSGFHRLRNNKINRALSLHVYAKPIEQSLTYDENLGRLVDKKLKYDTYKSVVSSEAI